MRIGQMPGICPIFYAVIPPIHRNLIVTAGYRKEKMRRPPEGKRQAFFPFDIPSTFDTDLLVRFPNKI